MITTDIVKTVRIGSSTVLSYTLNELVIVRSHKYYMLIALVAGALFYYSIQELWIIYLTCLVIAVGFLTEVRVKIDRQTVSKDFYFFNKQIMNVFALTILSRYKIDIDVVDISNNDSDGNSRVYIVEFVFDNTSYSLLRFSNKRNAERVRALMAAFLEAKIT
jgi:hypothetical protein